MNKRIEAKKTRTLGKKKCRLVKYGFSKKSDWIVSQEGFYEPIKCENDNIVISNGSGGQGDYYRPIKSKPKPKTPKGSVLAFAYKPNSRIMSVRLTKHELILHGVPKDKIIRVRITEVK